MMLANEYSLLTIGPPTDVRSPQPQHDVETAIGKGYMSGISGCLFPLRHT
jgi:hypothetical protein